MAQEFVLILDPVQALQAQLLKLLVSRQIHKIRNLQNTLELIFLMISSATDPSAIYEQ